MNLDSMIEELVEAKIRERLETAFCKSVYTGSIPVLASKSPRWSLAPTSNLPVGSLKTSVSVPLTPWHPGTQDPAPSASI